MDFLIQNGLVYDPGEHSMQRRSLALAAGKIARPDAAAAYGQTVDASGCIVTPGLIDYHVHFFGCECGVVPESNTFCCGITTAVDGGSAGASLYPLFRSTRLIVSHVRILAQLLVASGGQMTFRYPENLDPVCFDEAKIVELFRQYPDELVGLKTRISRGIIPNEGLAEASLRRTVEIAEKAGTRVIVHVTDCTIPLDRLAGILRPGDVICHIYHGKGENTCLKPDGRIWEGLWAARERGVIFDACNGRNNYDLAVCRSAMAQGFVPQIISSDVSFPNSFVHPLHSLPRIMSKYLDFGMALEDILDCATITPARLIGRAELGSLADGTTADVTVWKLKNKAVRHRDVNGHSFEGTQVLVPQMVFKDGACVYCQADFT